MKHFLSLFLASALASLQTTDFEELASEQTLVSSIKQIVFEEFPNSFNPSILLTDQGILMSFRYCPDPYFEPWTSYIGIALLNNALEPVMEPQLLDMRSKQSRVSSHAEDARLFTYRGRTFLIYNDNIEIDLLHYSDRRDMFIAELYWKNEQFFVSAPLKLTHIENYHCLCQKNWTPFEWNRKLWMAYTVNPHEILSVNLQDGTCYPTYSTEASIDWEYGTLRSGVPPQLVDEEFLSFCHSSLFISSKASEERSLYHYFMGAYTFSKDPPFSIRSITPMPIVSEGFYTPSECIKRVIFPGGFVVMEEKIHVAYGKDDCEIWIATIDKQELKKHLKGVS